MTNHNDRQRLNSEGFGFAVLEQSTRNDHNDFDTKRKSSTKGFFDTIQRIRSSIIIELRTRLNNFPVLSRLSIWWISLIPPRFFVLFLLWKAFMLFFFVNTAVHFAYIQNKGGGKIAYHSHAQEQAFMQHIRAQKDILDDAHPMRILHIVTALAEYNNGRRGTSKGDDRLKETLIPILSEGVKSMTERGWHVDVYFICGFVLTDNRKQLIIDSLPPNVGLEVWSNATPLGYDRQNFDTIQLITRSLARQHRYVIKDKLYHYDLFSVWEDDMYITANHVQYFLEVSDEINRLKKESLEHNSKSVRDSITGSLSFKQLERVYPGFFRVEVLKPDSTSQRTVDPIEVDLQFSDSLDPDIKPKRMNVNPEQCCFITPSNQVLSKRLPARPTYDQLVTWEVRIHGYSVREFPKSSSFGWVALQPGPRSGSWGEKIEGYWSGSNKALGPNVKKPTAGNPQYFGQQGGFMATRTQILEFERLCIPEFLPPFNSLKDNGLDRMNVEYWSGGQQLWGLGKIGCNFQRILVLDPERFSKHLIYHTANNKQNTIVNDRIIKVNDLMGQLNSVKKAAIKSISS